MPKETQTSKIRDAIFKILQEVDDYETLKSLYYLLARYRSAKN
jgi:hypothetical protein